jgi:peptidoglycan/xylan/chitin deacetylase (PgdA/CDA1 family)
MASFIPILTFHDISERPSVISIPPIVFQRGIKRLHEEGYQALRLIEAADFLRRGVPFPDRTFVVTFDDGYQSVHQEALPVLRHCGMSATVFLTTGEKGIAKSSDRLPSLSNRTMLSLKEVKEMQSCGIEFGAHTLTHPDLTSLPPGQAKAEISEARAILEDTLSAPIACFAYPYGRYDRRIREIVQRYFACACSDHLGLVTERSDLYGLERVDGYYLRTNRLFNVVSTRFFPWYILARSIPRRIRRAVKS